MAKSDYSYNLIKRENQQVLFIEDENLGNMSVTNDIENVVEEIADKHRLDTESLIVVYRDSEGVIDGYNHQEGRFIHINAYTLQEALEKI